MAITREINALKQEVQILMRELQSVEAGDHNIVKQEIGNPAQRPSRFGRQRTAMLRQEIDILRNEIQENIAAIHRLEVLTLSQRLNCSMILENRCLRHLPGKRDSLPKLRASVRDNYKR